MPSPSSPPPDRSPVPPDPGQRRRLLLASGALLLLILALLLEGVGFLYFHLDLIKQYDRIHLVRDPLWLDRFVDGIDPVAWTAFLAASHDPELGWIHRPGTSRGGTNLAGRVWSAHFAADGSRTDPLSAPPPFMATYGDSFIMGDEVDDGETWQHFLGERMGREVKNFGVGGYGPDQALGYFLRHRDQGAIHPVTVLGIYGENINRLPIRWWGFYGEGAGFQFKPRFHRNPASGEMEWLPNPHADSATPLSRIKELARRAAPSDGWASSRVVEPAFPFGPAFLHLHWRKRWLSLQRQGRGLWGDGETVGIMEHVVDRFIDAATGAGSRPLLLFFPEAYLLKQGREQHYAPFVQEQRLRHPEVAVVDLAETPLDWERFFVGHGAGHASPEGNRQVARVLAGELQRRGWLPAGEGAGDLHHPPEGDGAGVTRSSP